MTKTNRTFTLKQVNKFEFENRDLPKIVNDTDVLLKIINVGICGSDVHYWKEGFCGEFLIDGPLVLGHETAAVVVECGSKVTQLNKGDQVAIEPGVPCRMCEFCRTGDYNLCKSMIFHATPPYDGTLCQYIVHPADFCFKLPENVSSEEGAMLEPLSVAVHACRRAGVGVGSYVLIIGAGPIGLLNMMVAKARCAEKIVILDISQSRLDFAQKLGADYTILIDKSRHFEDISKEVTTKLGQQPNVSIECSGAPTGVEVCIDATRPSGCVMLVGLGPASYEVHLVRACLKEVDIRGCFRYVNDYPSALSLVATGKVNLKPLVTHRFGFEEAQKAFEMCVSGKGIKVIIEVSK